MADMSDGRNVGMDQTCFHSRPNNIRFLLDQVMTKRRKQFHGLHLKIQRKDLVSRLLQLETEKMSRDVARSVITYEKNMEDLVCTMCNSLFIEPTTLDCGHTFCKLCLEDEFSSQNCTTCGSVITKEVSAPTYQLCNIIAKWFPKHVEMEGKICKAKKLMEKEKFEEAQDCLTRTIESDGTLYAICYSLRADCNVAMGNFHLALSDIEIASEICPMSSNILNRKARIFLKMREYEQAVVVLLRCVALQPQNRKLYKELESNLDYLLRLDFPTSDNFLTKDIELTRRVESPDDLLTVNDKERGTGRGTGQTMSLKFPLNARDEFECKLCCNLLYKPVTSPCGHTFCSECLRRSLDHRVDCPWCRTPLTKYLAERRTVVTRPLENIITKFFPQEYQARKEAHEKELQDMKMIGQNPEFEIPIFVCTIGFPSVPCPLHIFEPKYKLMIRRCIESGCRQFGMCAAGDNSDLPFATTGTMLRINDVAYLPDGRSLINTEGIRRFQVLSSSVKDGYNVAKVKWLVDEVEDSEEEQMEIQRLHVEGYKLLQFWFCRLSNQQQECIVNAIGDVPRPEELLSTKDDKPKWLWWALAALPLTDKPKLIILSMSSVIERLRSIRRFLMVMIKMQQQNAAASG